MTTSPTFDALCPLLRTHSPELRDGTIAVTPEGSLAGLGIDSLELLALAVDLERAFEISIDDTALGSAKTVSDLVAVVDRAAGRISP